MSGKEGISPKSDEMQTLTDFSERIRSMRQALLAKIFGQDHAIHAFAEGIFNAGILAGVDEKRRQPRALFVFAGPSGVGKTFLAEQAAEALAIPFKRFDMSSFSDHQAHASLIGFAPSYKEARPGMLTGFVHDHPHSIVLFDEIEKAHLNTIQLFLQILDGGILHDDFLDKTISFKDTILIFTTNAGKQLYDREPKKIAAGFSRQTILNALENDVHPQTGAPLFPATICSRLATGYLIMFNHLHAHDLEKISAAELNRSFALFEKKYRIKVDADPLLPTALLLSEGGWTDARTLKAQTGLFFKNEIFKLLGAMESRRKTAFKNMESIHFSVPTAEAPETVIQLFENRSKPEVLLFGNAQLGETLRTAAPDITVINTSDVHEALKITAERDIDVVFIGIPDMPFYQMRNFFNLLRKRIPDMPIYLLTTDNTPADQDLASAFMRAGASGIRTAPDEKTQTLDDEKAQAHADEKTQAFAGEMETIVRQARRQNIATGFSAQHKTLAFETSAALVPSKKKAIIKLTNFSIRRAVQAEDNDLVLDEIEKPDTCFDDIVGARIAKEALTLFIDYLKHPRKFAALGLKPPTGVLLYGPPGTGKTLMAKAMAGESDATFIPASANALVASYRKSGSNAIRDLFKRAKRYTPAIIFIDEIEAIGRCGNSLIPGDYEKIALKILLTEMEETPVDQKRPVFVLAATNMEIGENNWGDETFDVALAHRFNSRIRMPLPDETDRKHYIQSVLAKRKNHRISERMIDYFANRSIDHSIADLESVIDMSYRLATQKNNPVTDKILEHAFESTHPGAKKYWDNEYWRE